MTVRTIKSSNLTLGCWYHSNQVVPPDNRQVLCCDEQKFLWLSYFDTDENLWSQNNYDSAGFFWQDVAKPLDCLFD